MRRGILLGSILLLGALALAQSEDPAPARTREPNPLMQAKLHASQKVLEGLVTRNFDLIRTGAAEMRKIAETNSWKGESDPVYGHYNREFRRLTERLTKLADDANEDGAAFSYMHLTTTCISCHQHVRDVLRMADEEGVEFPEKSRQ